MWISQISLENIRGFVGDENVIVPSRNINVIVGQNNSGKSTILSAIYYLQNPYSFTLDDLRKDEEIGNIFLTFENVPNHFNGSKFFHKEYHPFVVFRFNKYNSEINGFIPSLSIENPYREPVRDNHSKFFHFDSSEPNNLIYSHLSKRKVSYGDESVKSEYKNKVTGDYRYLNSKIDGLCSSSLPNAVEFRKICEDVLHFPISTVSTDNNKAIYPEKKDDFYQLHESVLSPVPAAINSPQSEHDKLFLRQSYQNKLFELGLIAPVYKRLQKGEMPEFDEKTGRLKSPYNRISGLGRMLLRYIDENFVEENEF